MMKATEHPFIDQALPRTSSAFDHLTRYATLSHNRLAERSRPRHLERYGGAFSCCTGKPAALEAVRTEATHAEQGVMVRVLTAASIAARTRGAPPKRTSAADRQVSVLGQKRTWRIRRQECGQRSVGGDA
jgi:hypothetical protein